MEIADLTESIKKRHPELRELNPQDFATTIDQLGDNLFKDIISTIVISLNTMVGKYNDDLLENTNQAQLFAERGNYYASFALIGNLCSYLQGQSGLSDDEKQAIQNIQELQVFLKELLEKEKWNLTIGERMVTITIKSIENRNVLILFILQYGERMNIFHKSLNEFIDRQSQPENAKII